MKLTGNELNLLVQMMDYSCSNRTKISSFRSDVDETNTEALELLDKLDRWSIKTSTKGDCDHDYQMYDNWIHLYSPNKKETKIYDRHCAAQGFDFDSDETYDINE